MLEHAIKEFRLDANKKKCIAERLATTSVVALFLWLPNIDFDFFQDVEDPENILD